MSFCLLWWTPRRNTANFWQRLTKVKAAFGPPCFYRQEAAYKFYSCKYVLLFYAIGRTTQRTELRDRSVKTRATNSHFWGRVGLKPERETANVFLAGFQNCFGPVPPVCFLSFPFLDKRSTHSSYAISVPAMYVGWEGQMSCLCGSQVFRSLETALGLNLNYTRELRLYLDLI